jgi:hypothetical protein
MEQIRCLCRKDKLLTEKLYRLKGLGLSLFLHDMNDALVAYCKPLLLGDLHRTRHWERPADPTDDAIVDKIWDRLSRGVSSAVLAEDLPRFLEQRRIVMKMMSLLIMYRTDRVLGDDIANKVSAAHRYEPGMLQLVGGFQIEGDPGSAFAIKTDLDKLYDLPFN